MGMSQHIFFTSSQVQARKESFSLPHTSSICVSCIFSIPLTRSYPMSLHEQTLPPHQFYLCAFRNPEGLHRRRPIERRRARAIE